MFGPKYQKAHPYVKSGRINRLAYVAVAVFKRYTAPRKKYARTLIGNSRSSITLQQLPHCRDIIICMVHYIEKNVTRKKISDF